MLAGLALPLQALHAAPNASLAAGGRVSHAAPREHPRYRSPNESLPPEIGRSHQDRHMSVEERKLLRQHIEDAVRELYRR